MPSLWIKSTHMLFQRMMTLTQIGCGTNSDNKLNFNQTTDFIHKRCRPRIFYLQKLRSLNVSAAVLHTFYWSCSESFFLFLFSFPVLYWYPCREAGDVWCYPPGILGLLFDSPFLSPLLFFLQVLPLFLSWHFSANGPFSWLFSRKLKYLSCAFFV